MGSTVAPKNPATAAANVTNEADNQHIEFKDLLVKAKEKISPEQALRLNSLENSVVRGDVKDQKIHVFHQLARFWSDSAKLFEPYAWYTGEAAKLENSEKSLTFAAQLYIDNLVTEGDPAMQHWLAEQAKDLLEKALVINPNNDSSKIGLGACYIFGNISNNPMEGILPIRNIVQKNPDNLYAQMILGLGGKKSGQLDKAIERFLLIVNKDPENLEAIFHLAECYEMHNDKTNAVKWYTLAAKKVKVPEAKEAIAKRIAELKK
jgi:tetratricopeptide (TPR) repeat protein